VRSRGRGKVSGDRRRIIVSSRSLLIIAVAVCALFVLTSELTGRIAAEETGAEELGGAMPPSMEAPPTEGVSPAPTPSPETTEEAAPTEEAPLKEGVTLTLWQMMQAGGAVMIAIIVLSVVALSLVIEGFFSISINRLIPGSFVSELERHVGKGDVEAVARHCDDNAGPLSNLVRTAVSAGESAEKRLEAVAAAGEVEGEALFHRANYLSIFATIAPMLGLMGTVFGMIRAFNTVAFQAGLGKPQLLAKGISQALITTAAGLIVGIPTMFLYFYFRSRGNRILLAMESGARALVEWHPEQPSTKPRRNLFPMRLRVAMEEALGEAIIGVFFLGFILGPLAMRKGLRARKEAASSPQATPMWKGAVAVVVGAFDLVLYLGAFGFFLLRWAA
jgi:biopolymer transport protein ExbB